MLERLGKAAGKRVGLRFRYVNRTTLQCHIAIESKYVSVAEDMAASFGCQITRSTPPPSLPGVFLLAGLPPDFMAVDAYIINGQMFVLPLYGREVVSDEPNGTDGEKEDEVTDSHSSIFFPAPGSKAIETSETMEAITGVASMSGVNDWQLPPPTLGTSIRMSLSINTPSSLLKKEQQWLLGWDKNGRSVGAFQAGVMGEPNTVDGWLTSLLLATIQNSERNIILVDGEGRLVDALLSRPHVVRLIHSGLIHPLDVRRSLQTSFNPLAIPLSRNPVGAAIRWNWWLQGMGAQTTVELMNRAILDGVTTIPDLYGWAKILRKKHPEIGTSITVQLQRLDQDQEVRDWIMGAESFVDPRLLAKRGIVLATIRLSDGGSRWARQHALRGLIGLMIESRSSLILHQVKLDKADRKLLRDARFIVSHMPASTVVITKCQASLAQTLAPRFSKNGSGTTAVTSEHLQLLPPRTAIVNNRHGQTALVSWKTKL